VRGVVGAGGLAIVAGGAVEREGGGVAVDLGVELEEGLVDGAELVGADAAPGDLAADVALGEGAEGEQGGEQVVVVELGAVEVGGGLGAEEEGAEGGEAELGAAGVELGEEEVEGAPEVAVRAAAAA
jgi:hypothetical protein